MNSKQRRKDRREWPYIFRVAWNEKKWDDICDWCKHNLHREFYRVSTNSYYAEYKFRDQRDYVHFALRWS